LADDKVLITEGTLDNIADAIREKNGESHLYYPREMPAAIRRIPTGSGSGSVVAVYPILLDGTHIADIEVDGENFAIYAPTPKVYTQGTGIEISSSGVVSVSEALRTTISGKVDTDTFTTAIASLTASLASKQDLLTAGNGITIQGNVISADGTDVEANPTGTPTDELNTIRIGEDIYEIVGGGGGGSKVVDLIYENANRTIENTVVLDNPYTDYDFLIFEISDIAQYSYKLQTMIVLKEQLDDALTNSHNIAFYQAADSYIIYTVTDATTLTKSNAQYQCITKIYGVKMGGGGTGGESYKTENLYDNPTGNIASGEITLAHSILDYDDIEFVAGIATSSDRGRTAVRINAQYFYDTFKYTTAHSANHYGISFWADMVVDVSLGQGDDPTKLNFFNQYGSVNTSLYQINGIKYGTGGGAGGASALEDLTDVDLTNLSNDQILKWDATAQKWENDDEKQEIPNIPQSYTGKILGAKKSNAYGWISLGYSNGLQQIIGVDHAEGITRINYALDTGAYFNVDDEYDNTATYNTGDYAIYENKWYKCKADNTTGSWDSTKWDEVPLSNLLPLIGQGGGLPFDVVIDANDNGINLVYDDGQ
jgi:hypothetical protein